MKPTRDRRGGNLLRESGFQFAGTPRRDDGNANRIQRRRIIRSGASADRRIFDFKLPAFCQKPPRQFISLLPRRDERRRVIVECLKQNSPTFRRDARPSVREIVWNVAELARHNRPTV